MVAPTWTTVSNWTATITLAQGTNLVSVIGYDLRNQMVSGASNSIITVYDATNVPSLHFAPGNLAVLRAGDGTQTLGSHGNSVFIDQFRTNGTLVNSLAIPDDTTNALLVSGSASSEGALTLSADKRLLMLGGYQITLSNAAALGTSLANADSSAAPRAVAAVDANGGFALTGVTYTQYGANNMRGGTSDGRGNYWGAGAASGTYYFGNGTPETVQSVVKNSEAIQDVGGDLFFSTSKTTAGIWEIPGAPMNAATPTNILVSATASPYGFAFSPNRQTVYIADDTLTGKGGIQRWNLTNGAWAMAYAFAGITNVGARGVAVDFSKAQPLIYATTAEATGNRLVSLADTGAAASVKTLATAAANEIFRGVAFTPDTNVQPEILRATRTSSSFTVEWTTLTGGKYTVEYADSLVTPSWQTLASFIATGPTGKVVDTTISSAASRFYRIILGP
jgi:hypothetical protein